LRTPARINGTCGASCRRCGVGKSRRTGRRRSGGGRCGAKPELAIARALRRLRAPTAADGTAAGTGRGETRGRLAVHPCHIRTTTRPSPATSALGLGPSRVGIATRPIIRAHIRTRTGPSPAHICSRTRPAPATSAPGPGLNPATPAPGLGSPRPRPHQDRAGSGLTPHMHSAGDRPRFQRKRLRRRVCVCLCACLFWFACWFVCAQIRPRRGAAARRDAAACA
jgi:hypothetical protein